MQCKYIISVCIAGCEVQHAETFFIRRIRPINNFFAHILIGKTILEVYCIDAIFPHVRREDMTDYIAFPDPPYSTGSKNLK